MSHRANTQFKSDDDLARYLRAKRDGQKVGPVLTDATSDVVKVERRKARLAWGVLLGIFALASYLVYRFAESVRF